MCVLVCLHVHVFVYTCMFVCTYVCIHVQACACIQTMYVRVNVETLLLWLQL